VFRPMRRHAQQLDHEECVRILKAAPRGTLAVLGDDEYPYALPLDFFYDENAGELGTFYFHCATEGHKIDAIAAHDKASFCVLDEGRLEEGSWWYHFNSVIAFGRIRRLEDWYEVYPALKKLGERYFPPTEDVEADIARNRNRVALLALEVEHLTGKHVREK